MTSLWCLEFLLCLQLLHQACSEEPELVFRAQGSVIELGYCFGVDYIVVYRSAPGGDQLLGNSSAHSEDVTPPADLQGRVHINQHLQLLGLQIRNLTHLDSGMYRRECWQNQKLSNQLVQQLSVCDEEVESKEIVVNEEAAGVQLLCNSTSVGLEGTSVLWYHEMYPSYKLTLFLDSGVSLEPLVEGMKGVVEVRDGGAVLVVDRSLLKSLQHFHCLVIRGKKCLSYQNMYSPEHIESRDIFVSHGDRVVLKCPSDGKSQQWDTPLGKINGSSTSNTQMYISAGDRAQDFSLVIPAITDEHIGDYSCSSTSLELQYLLILCAKKKPQEKLDSGGRNFSLECKVNHSDSQRVLWYRTEASGEYLHLLDSTDQTAASHEDLQGRVTLSDNGSSLMISGVEMSDAGVYWCVVLEGPEFLEHDDDYKYDDYDEEDTEDEEYGDASFWPNAHRCIFKQETTLTLIKPVKNLEANPSDDPPPASNVTAYPLGAGLWAGLGAGVVTLLVVGVIVAVVVKKMAKSRSEIDTDKDINMKQDPGCTKSLTGDECGA